jgi:hypothetical protein
VLIVLLFAEVKVEVVVVVVVVVLVIVRRRLGIFLSTSVNPTTRVL